MDAANYKDYILHMLFLKYVSDKFKEDFPRGMVGVQAGNKRKEEIVRKSLEFNIPGNATFDVIYNQRNNSEEPLGSVIDKAFAAIENANKTKLQGIFRGVKFYNPTLFGNSMENILISLLEKFKSLDLGPSQGKGDVIGDAYIYLIGQFASDAGKKAGEFYTPLQVSRLLAKLANPSKGNHICDPACGTGGLLLEAAEETGSPQKANLYGMERNASTWSMCKLNMFMHNHSGENIKKCDTLQSPELVEGNKLIKFDTIVANPPFSLKNWGVESAEHDKFSRFSRGIPPNKAADWAFISHMIETAKPRKGRIAVITPHGVLFRGNAEKRIRRAVIEENILDAVIGIPSNLFQTTSIPVVILIFDLKRQGGGAKEKLDDILFIDASPDYISGRAQNYLSKEHGEKILDTYRNRTKVKRYSQKVSLKEIRENDYNLNISRYIDTFPEEEQVDIGRVQLEINKLESELSKTQRQMKKSLKEIV